MFSFSNHGTGDRRGASRRDFLRTGAMGAVGLSLADLTTPSLRASTATADRSVILLMLTGGPSQLDSFDPKPDAPVSARGPFRSIQTAIPGVRVVEHLPGLARRMDRVTLVRSLSHDEAPIHETGQQLLQTGGLCRLDQERPHVGALAAAAAGSRNDLPPFVMLPGPIGNTGVGISHGQSAGSLGSAFLPFALEADPASSAYDSADASDRARAFLDASHRAGLSESRPGLFASARAVRDAFNLDRECDAVRASYGESTFGQSCLLARRLVESGVRLVTVNMYRTVFHQTSWDCHGGRPFSSLDDYRREVLPAFDAAYTALLDDLERRGLLESTLVVASGEFGRTPWINAAGGRDHWPGVWSGLIAGGGTAGGRVIGASDSRGAEPADRPVHPTELFATIQHHLGLPASASGGLAAGETRRPLAEAFA